jgi:hypothetical protein
LANEAGEVAGKSEEALPGPGTRLEDAAAANIAKITDRAARGVLGGDGDHR